MPRPPHRFLWVLLLLGAIPPGTRASTLQQEVGGAQSAAKEERYSEAFEHWKHAYEMSLASGDKSGRKALLDKIIPGMATLGLRFPEARGYLESRLRKLTDAATKSEAGAEAAEELVEICAGLRDTGTLLTVLKNGGLNPADGETLRVAALPVLVDNGKYAEAAKYCDIPKTVALGNQVAGMRAMLGGKAADKLCIELLSPCYEAFLGNGDGTGAKAIAVTILQIDPTAERDLKRRAERAGLSGNPVSSSEGPTT